MKAPSLSEEESTFLLSLPLLPRCRRIRELCGEGWSLQSIADAFTPPRRRSTVRSWLLKPLDDEDPATHYPQHQPAPSLRRPPLKVPRPRRHRPISPGVPLPTQIQIARLAPLARRYRSRTPTHSASHRANRELSALTLALNQEGVTVSELARAGAVTYRAMKRRIEKEIQRAQRQVSQE